MANKYCSNCKEYKESWADKLGSHHSDKRCWKCDKYTLEEVKTVMVAYTHETHLGCNPSTGGYWKKDIYRNADGTTTTTYIQRGYMGPQTAHTVAPPKSGTCQIL